MVMLPWQVPQIHLVLMVLEVLLGKVQMEMFVQFSFITAFTNKELLLDHLLR